MTETLDALRERFGDRFGDMRLAACETTYWPVYRHAVRYSVTKTVPLNVVEEGLLRLVNSGITSLAEISRFLGASSSYVTMLAMRMASGASPAQELLVIKNDRVSVMSGPGIDGALRLCQRNFVEQQELILLRDGIFGTWLNRSEARLKVIRVPKPKGDKIRWLGTKEDARIQSEPGFIPDLGLLDDARGEAECTFDKQGALAWVEVMLGIYQASDGRKSRLLMFNMENDCQPLDDLSGRFERLLGESDVVPLYYDDRLNSAKAYWAVVASGVRAVDRENQLQEFIEELKAAEESYCAKTRRSSRGRQTEDDLVIEYTSAIYEAVVWRQERAVFEVATSYRRAVSCLIEILNLRSASPASEQVLSHVLADFRAAGMEELARKIEVHDQDSRGYTADFEETAKQFGSDLLDLLRDSVEDLRHLGSTLGVHDKFAEEDRNLFQQLRDAQKRIENLQSKLQGAPVVRALETRDHPELLLRALREVKQSLVIFSPWIKKGVVNKILPEIEKALRKGVRIWIGYGMPADPWHEDSSDPIAIEALRKLRRFGDIFLVDLSRYQGTHAKEIVCDDNFNVVTSFNWLSYSGNDRRRETGLFVSGRTFVGDRLNECILCLSGFLDKTREPSNV